MDKGQFGTRLGARIRRLEYHTNLNKLTQESVSEADDGVLKYLDDDGTGWANHYTPLFHDSVNGSRHPPVYTTLYANPYHMEYVEKSIQNKSDKPKLVPYYEGFKGTITPITETKWLFKGCYEVISAKEVRVTELPVGTWTDDYKKYIEELIEGDTKTNSSSSKDKGKKKSTSASIVRDYTDMSTDVIVDITIKFSPNEIEKLQAKETEYGCNALEKLLKLYTTRTTTNMHVFDETEKLRKFDTPEQVVDHYMGVRMQTYVVRKQHQVGILEREAMILSNKARFFRGIERRFGSPRKRCKLDS